MKNLGRKVIITCAVTGGGSFDKQHPAFPVTPKEIAASCIEAAAAGAAIVHVHVRDPATGGPSRDPRLFKETCDRIREANSDVVVNLTAGHGAYFVPDPHREGAALPVSDVVSVDERLEHLELCRPDMASIDLTTSNQIGGKTDYIYFNPAHTLRAMAKRFNALNIKPELEIYNPGDLEFGKALQEEGLITGTPLYQFVLGFRWTAPANVRTIAYLKDMLPPGANWAALGPGAYQMPVVAQAALLGGNVRVGLEDNHRLPDGSFATNGKLVAAARALLETMGFGIANSNDARNILGLPNDNRVQEPVAGRARQ